LCRARGMGSQLGFVLVILSAVFNGSFVAFAKIKSVAAAEVHPILFNFYLVLGVFLSSWIAAAFMPLVDAPLTIPWLGLLAGSLLVMATSCSFVAVSYIGLSTGQGVWGGTAILVSFIWGSVGPGDPGPGAAVKSWGVSAAALVLLLIGVGIIVKLQDIASWYQESCGDRSQTGDGVGACDQLVLHTLMDSDAQTKEKSERASSKPAGGSKSGSSSRFIGLLFALCVGISGGSVLVPLTFTGDEYKGRKAIAFLPAFGVGALVAGVLLTGMWYWHACRVGDPPALQLRETLWAGLLSGVVWNAGNVCSLIAMEVEGVPYGVAYPLFQASLVVAGGIGIFCFKEQTEGPPITVFFCGALIILTGSALLGVYGPQG